MVTRRELQKNEYKRFQLYNKFTLLSLPSLSVTEARNILLSDTEFKGEVPAASGSDTPLVTEILPVAAKAMSTPMEALPVPSKAPIEALLAASKVHPAPTEGFQPMHYCSSHRLQYENKLVEHKELLIT